MTMTYFKVCGSNRLGQISSSNDEKISPGQGLNDTLISYSTYRLHTIIIDNEGYAYQSGSTDPEKCYATNNSGADNQKIEIQIDDGENIYQLLSAVCGYCYTLYLVRPLDPENNDSRNRLAYSYASRGDIKPFFLDIKNINPQCIFGGWRTSAAIAFNNNIIIVSPSPSPPKIITFNSDNKDEHPTSIACCKDYLLILTTKNRVFQYMLNQIDNANVFQLIKLDNDEKVEQISGTYQHCFIVTKEHVFAKGANNFGQLGLGPITNENKRVDEFKLVETLKGVQSAYAGFNHSLFLTKDKLLACGSNSHGQLFIEKKQGEPDIFPTPVECQGINDTNNKDKPVFCIAGDCSSIVFFKNIPSNCPNQSIHELSPLPQKIRKVEKKPEVDDKPMFHSEPKRSQEIDNDDSDSRPKSTDSKKTTKTTHRKKRGK
ncbi:hypothetical protein M9Y10_031569 [Tritrichomonas musculus]|uniref:Uncharacterized protein n=1 Tax=Tritrichomonas musculus TaxID=1915356 RepID=A0ABR2H0Y8_9EUKA